MRVAAVQWAWRTGGSRQALEDALCEPLQQAVQAGAELVVFAAGVDRALAEGLSGWQPPYGAAGGVSALSGAPAPGYELHCEFERLGRSLARAYPATLALGSVLWPASGGFQRVAMLFGPGGQVLGTQGQTHRSPTERAGGLQVAEVLAPIATPVGPIGILNGVDVEYPEVSRILCLQGATILVHHGELSAFSEAVALSRLWREVQANQVFGVEAYSVWREHRGRSGILAPIEMTADGSGWLARAPDDRQPAVVLADLDFERLKAVVDAYPIYSLRNPGQYRRYFPLLYEGCQETGSDRP